MRKTYKYRLLGNKVIFAKTDNWLVLCQRLYNVALEQRISIHYQNKGSISCYEQMHQLPELRKAFLEYKEVDAQVLQEVLERLDRAYKAFFRRVKNGGGKAGFPRFKSRDRYDSFTLKQHGWKLDGKYLSIRNVGRFKLRLSRPIEGAIKTVTIRREAPGKWYVCFSCANIPERRLLASSAVIGIDVGIKAFCVDSEGGTTNNPKYFRQSEKLMRLRQRRLARRIKGSHSRANARVLVASAHKKIRNQRNDFLHKVANRYVTGYGTIVIESLNIKGMVQNTHLSKSISDASWGQFFNLLAYKAEEAGRQLIAVPSQNTSQICSGCGEKVPKSLAVRVHDCPYCGLVMDRDENAARNISRAGQARQALTWENAPCVA